MCDGVGATVPAGLTVGEGAVLEAADAGWTGAPIVAAAAAFFCACCDLFAGFSSDTNMSDFISLTSKCCGWRSSQSRMERLPDAGCRLNLQPAADVNARLSFEFKMGFPSAGRSDRTSDTSLAESAVATGPDEAAESFAPTALGEGVGLATVAAALPPRAVGGAFTARLTPFPSSSKCCGYFAIHCGSVSP